MDRGAWRLQSMMSQRVRQNWATNTFTFVRPYQFCSSDTDHWSNVHVEYLLFPKRFKKKPTSVCVISQEKYVLRNIHIHTCIYTSFFLESMSETFDLFKFKFLLYCFPAVWSWPIDLHLKVINKMRILIEKRKPTSKGYILHGSIYVVFMKR